MKTRLGYLFGVTGAAGCLLVLPAAGGCPGGGCSAPAGPASVAAGGGCGSPMIGTFKGGAARLPVVASVDGNKFTTSKEKTYVLDAGSEIIIDGRVAKAADLKAGMRVLVSGKSLDAKNKVYRAVSVTARTPREAVQAESDEVMFE